MSTADELGIEILLKGFFIKVANGEVSICIHDDAVLVHFLNLGEIDDVGTVYAHEIIGQPFLHFFHGEEGDENERRNQAVGNLLR